MKEAPITDPIIHYTRLSRETLRRLSGEETEAVAIGLLAERARLREHGKILAWSEFNENPDVLVNLLLARLLVHKVHHILPPNLASQNIAVLSIENSAGYLATEITHELEEKLALTRPPRIIRARKSPSQTPPSPAMGEYTAAVTVYPITAAPAPRHLVASMTNTEDLSQTRVLLPIDDFRATGNSLRGGVELGIALLVQAKVPAQDLLVIPMAGLGKPEQEQPAGVEQFGATVTRVFTALDVRFWPDETSDQVLIQANGFPPYSMHQATRSDFA